MSDAGPTECPGEADGIFVLRPSRAWLIRFWKKFVLSLMLVPLCGAVLIFIANILFGRMRVKDVAVFAGIIGFWGPVVGLIIGIMFTPGFLWVMKDMLRNHWELRADRVDMFFDGKLRRTILWQDVSEVKLASYGPNLLVRNAQQGEMLTFVPPDDARQVRVAWSGFRRKSRLKYTGDC